MSKFKAYKTQEEKKQTLSENLRRNLARRKQQTVEKSDLKSEISVTSKDFNSDFVFIERKKKNK